MASWLKAHRQSTAVPAERTSSLAARTWYQQWPPLISAGYDSKVKTLKPMSEMARQQISPAEMTPSPDSPAKRNVKLGICARSCPRPPGWEPQARRRGLSWALLAHKPAAPHLPGSRRLLVLLKAFRLEAARDRVQHPERTAGRRAVRWKPG